MSRLASTLTSTVAGPSSGAVNSSSNGIVGSSTAPLTVASASSVGVAGAAISDLHRVSTKRLAGGHRSQVRHVAWNADGRRLATGAQDGTLRVWQPEKDARSSVEYRGHTGEVSLVRWNPTHAERLASCSATGTDKSLHFWDMRQGNKPTHTVATEGENIQMTWSPDGKTVVVSSRRDIMTWIDVNSQQVIKKWDVGRETNESIFSHDGRILFMAIDGYAHLTAFPDGQDIHKVQVSPAAVTVLDLDPRGRYLAAGANDAIVTLWETRDWTCVASMGAHEDPPRVVRFSADGQYLASACGDKEIVISEVPTLKPAITLAAGGSVDTLAWHPTRNLLAYAGDELEAGRTGSGVVKIWGL